MISRPLAIALLAVTILPSVTLADADESPQAQREHDFARWEKAIAGFEQQDEESPPPKNGTLFVGSSSIRKWDLKKWFPDRRAINRGFGGSEIIDSVHFADRLVLKHRPRIILMYAGDNDISRGTTARQVHIDFQQFVSRIRKDLPDSRICFIAIKPSLKRWNLVDEMRKANQLIAAECETGKNLRYIDIFTPMIGEDGRPKTDLFVKDGLHLSDAGYRLWTSIVRPYLE